jgi:hypothetical protein
MAKVSSLWLGNPLPIPHQIALSSFVYYGHEVKLYVYDMDLAVPAGVIKADANTILKEKEVFTHFGKYAAFSDLFRYAMILKTGEMWIDTDMFCFSKNFFEDAKYLFVEEAAGIYCGNLLKLPQDSEIAKWLYVNAKANGASLAVSSPESNLKNLSWESWTYIGPALLTKAIKKHKLENFAIAKEQGHIIDIHNEDPRELFWNPDFLKTTLDRASKATSGSFFNSWLDQRHFNKNDLPKGSAIEVFYSRYMLGVI